MEPVTLEHKEKESTFEFYNYWKDLKTMGFQLFSVNPIDALADYHATSLVIFNFEFRFYRKRK